MSEVLDKEVVAISAMIKSLEVLEEGARQRALNYVAERMGVKLSNTNSTLAAQAHVESPAMDFVPQVSVPSSIVGLTDIRSLKDQKQPRTAIQMAVLVAYYLQDLSPARKDSVSAQDLTTYFKQAGYPLPKGEIRFTLVNAKNAGYFESAGDGRFKLNPVGYNLAVHQLPGLSGKTEGTKGRKKQVNNKKVSRK